MLDLFFKSLDEIGLKGNSLAIARTIQKETYWNEQVRKKIEKNEKHRWNTHHFDESIADKLVVTTTYFWKSRENLGRFFAVRSKLWQQQEIFIN